MSNIQNIKEKLEKLISGKKSISLFTGDKESSLLFHIVNGMDINTIFIDTGFHFDETLKYTKQLDDKIEIIYNHIATIDSTVDMHECCSQRKGVVLQEYITQSGAECLIVPFTDKGKQQVVEDSYLNGIENIAIIRPFGDLTERDVWTMINNNKVPFSPLYNKGFKVIDCKCCTTRIGRKRSGEEQKSSEMDRETVEKLKSLGYM